MTDEEHRWQNQQPIDSAELSDPDALREIDALHRRGTSGTYGVVRCTECVCEWPCPTNQIIEKARRRQR